MADIFQPKFPFAPIQRFLVYSETGYVELNGNDVNIFGGTNFKMTDIFQVFITFTQISMIFGLYGKQGKLS